MFEPSKFAFLVVAVFLLSNNGAQCYYSQPAPYAPYSPYPYPYTGQYAPVQPPSWNNYYQPYPYGPAAAPAYAPPVATPAPASQTRLEAPPSPSLPVVDFKKGSIIDYEYFYDTLPEDSGKTIMIIMLNKTQTSAVHALPAPIETGKPVFKPPSFDNEDQSVVERKVVDETKETIEAATEQTTEEMPEVKTAETADWLNEDVTEESVTEEVTPEELVEETTVEEEYQFDEDEESTPLDD